MKIVFSAISPHPPLLLPWIGQNEDRAKVKNTIGALRVLNKRLLEKYPDLIIISSPHPDWGFNVPLYFLAKNFKGKIEEILIGQETPQYYFEKGKEYFLIKDRKSPEKIALIASGDMSHCLKKEGPYGFHPDGPKFDKSFINALNKKDLKTIIKLDDMFPNAAECGLRSFCFMLGMVEAQKEKYNIDWQPEILSYEGPFGVGYLSAELKIKK